MLSQGWAVKDQFAQHLQFGQMPQVLQMQAFVTPLIVTRGLTLAQKDQGACRLKLRRDCMYSGLGVGTLASRLSISIAAPYLVISRFVWSQTFRVF